MAPERRSVYTFLGLSAAIVGALLLLAALPHVLPAHRYTATELPADADVTLSNRTLAEGAERNADVERFDALSSRERAAFQATRGANDTGRSSPNASLLADTDHLVRNGTLFDLNTTETDGERRFAVSAVSGRDALPIVAVPTTVFDASSAFYAPDSKRHVVESAIENAAYTSPTIVRVNRTLVSYRGSYYLLNSSSVRNG